MCCGGRGENSRLCFVSVFGTVCLSPHGAGAQSGEFGGPDDVVPVLVCWAFRENFILTLLFSFVKHGLF